MDVETLELELLITRPLICSLKGIHECLELAHEACKHHHHCLRLSMSRRRAATSEQFMLQKIELKESLLRQA